MLWIKGIREFVEAANLLKRKGITARFVLAGIVIPTVRQPSPAAAPELADFRCGGVVGPPAGDVRNIQTGKCSVSAFPGGRGCAKGLNRSGS